MKKKKKKKKKTVLSLNRLTYILNFTEYLIEAVFFYNSLRFTDYLLFRIMSS